MKQMTCLFMTAIVTLAATFSSAAAQEESTPSTEPKITQLLRELNSANYARRVAATRDLVRAGAAAVGPLVETAQGEEPESAVRAVKVLEKIYLSGRHEDVAASEAALEFLVTVKNRAVVARAEVVLAVHNDVRQSRALERVLALGGEIQTTEDNPAGEANKADVLMDRGTYLLLGNSWKGGDDGLKYVKRLTNLRVIYYSGNHGLSDDGITALQQALPETRIDERGSAKLGVMAMAAQGPCIVNEVKNGSAAHKGGIRPQDRIVKFDNQPVPHFDALVDLIKKRNPGDKVEVIVERATVARRTNVPVKLTVILDGWSKSPKK